MDLSPFYITEIGADIQSSLSFTENNSSSSSLFTTPVSLFFFALVGPQDAQASRLVRLNLALGHPSPRLGRRSLLGLGTLKREARDAQASRLARLGMLAGP